MEPQTRSIFIQALFDSIAETQKDSGRDVQPMTEDTVPLLDLTGFDSHNGLEVEIQMSIRLGIEIENLPLHAGKRGTRELKIREIVDALVNKYGKKFSAVSTEVEELATH
jgi:hypothetical protein